MEGVADFRPLVFRSPDMNPTPADYLTIGAQFDYE